MRSAILVAIAGFAVPAIAQPVTYERATLGTTGITSGGGIAATNWFYTGWRFEVTGGPVTTTRIGGHFFGGSGTIFGAIVRLTGPNDDPDSWDLTTPDVLGTTLITLPTGGSNDVGGPISLTLTDGWYLCIFGGGAFGSTNTSAGFVAQDPGTATPGAQLNITYRQASHPVGQGGPFLQGSVGRVFIEGNIGGGTPCYANCDGSTISPVLNVNDFTCFLNRYAAGESYANCDASTIAPVLNVNDFTCFLNSYAVGCP